MLTSLGSKKIPIVAKCVVEREMSGKSQREEEEINLQIQSPCKLFAQI